MVDSDVIVPGLCGYQLLENYKNTKLGKNPRMCSRLKPGSLFPPPPLFAQDEAKFPQAQRSLLHYSINVLGGIHSILPNGGRTRIQWLKVVLPSDCPSGGDTC